VNAIIRTKNNSNNNTNSKRQKTNEQYYETVILKKERFLKTLARDILLTKGSKEPAMFLYYL
jgi:hypothetical protein